jgi:hypothetical protein
MAHVPSATRSPEFVFGQIGGLAPGGRFKVSIYSDGKVTLKKQGPGNVRLLNPALKVSQQARSGMLTLAKSEGFATLSSNLPAPSKILDMPSYTITIRLARLTSSVKLIRASSPAFAELYAVLMYVSSTCIYAGATPQVCSPVRI